MSKSQATYHSPADEHYAMVELETDYGRHWSEMLDTEVDDFVDEHAAQGYRLSDIDHSPRCWCLK